ncbi:MAG: GXGXG motif-containing protein [Planctomycetaceae bacterium]|nr:GXGXG motif-containing protein [Planctomycetaceae bacterium]
MVEIDGSSLTVREINTTLRAHVDRLHAEGRLADEPMVLRHPDARHNLGVGVVHPVQLTIAGSAGYFCMGLCDGPNVHIEGNVGWGFADNLLAGRMEVDGYAGAVCAVAMRDGQIVIRGNVGSRVGQVMKGGSVICGGNAGFGAGSMMMGGTIIILGNAAQSMGEFMMDGNIFVAGDITSLGTDAVVVDQLDADADRIAELLDSAGLKPPVEPRAFKKIISDQRALKYQEYEKNELLFNEAQEQKAQSVAADGNRDVMTFDSD